jgi:hypothetical protein
MIDEKFTKEERAYLISFDALDELRAGSLVYSEHIKEECMRRLRKGERSGEIFA